MKPVPVPRRGASRRGGRDRTDRPGRAGAPSRSAAARARPRAVASMLTTAGLSRSATSAKFERRRRGSGRVSAISVTPARRRGRRRGRRRRRRTAAPGRSHRQQQADQHADDGRQRRRRDHEQPRHGSIHYKVARNAGFIERRAMPSACAFSDLLAGLGADDQRGRLLADRAGDLGAERLEPRLRLLARHRRQRRR